MQPNYEKQKPKNNNIDTILAQPSTFKFKQEELNNPKNFEQRTEMANGFNQKIDSLTEDISSRLINRDKKYDAQYSKKLTDIGEKIYGVMDELLKRNQENQITFIQDEGDYEVRFTIKMSGDKDKRLLLEEIKTKKVTPDSQKINGISEEKLTERISINPSYRAFKDTVTVMDFTDRVKDNERKTIPGRTEDMSMPEDLTEIFAKYGDRIKSKYDEVLFVENKKLAA